MEDSSFGYTALQRRFLARFPCKTATSSSPRAPPRSPLRLPERPRTCPQNLSPRMFFLGNRTRDVKRRHGLALPPERRPSLPPASGHADSSAGSSPPDPLAAEAVVRRVFLDPAVVERD